MNDWTNGLRTGISNALINYGFKCRADVIDEFTNGGIHFKKPGGGCTVYGLGERGIVELRAWLGLPIKIRKKKTALELAINEAVSAERAWFAQVLSEWDNTIDVEDILRNRIALDDKD